MKEESEQMHLTSRLQFWGKELVAHPFYEEMSDLVVVELFSL